MRLIDADNINFHCNYDGDCTGDIDDCKECGNYICDFRDIQEQPIAYDIDKAIDDFVKFASDMPTVETESGEIRPMWLEEMAEKLKAGGENDNLRR